MIFTKRTDELGNPLHDDEATYTQPSPSVSSRNDAGPELREKLREVCGGVKPDVIPKTIRVRKGRNYCISKFRKHSIDRKTASKNSSSFQ